MDKIIKAVLVAMVAFSAAAYGGEQSRDAWKQEVERKLDILTRELENTKLGDVAEPVYKSVYGFSPAASKVYHMNQGVSIGGYGEMTVQDFKGSRDDGTASGKKREADFLRAILYTGYKFTEKILFNSEIEIEHAATAGGSGARGEVSVEFAYLDFMLAKPLGIRTGMVLVPMGFVNELHEPVIFHGARRPGVETNVIPTTWRENGAGFFGESGPFSYRTYLLAGLQGVKDASPGVKGFGALTGIRDGRSKGTKSQAEDLAWVGRLDYKGLPGTMIGGSVYSGRAGQSETNVSGGNINAPVTLWEVHGSAEYRGLELRGIYTQGRIGDVADLNAKNGLTGNSSIGERLFGGYLQVAFDVLSLTGGRQYLAPFFRYERYDTQQRVPSGFSKNPANSRTEYTYGITYKPHPNTVVKADWQNMNNQAGTGIDQFNLAVGYLF